VAKLKTSAGESEHRVVSHDEWLAARKAFLIKEKEFTRLRDQLSQQRRDLPWEKVDKNYLFDAPNGKESLADLFAGKSQLIVYHFMFAPEATQGCSSCSFWADNFNDIIIHLKQRDVTMLAISLAPVEKLEAFKKRMGWSFKWVSSGQTDFNYDYHASFRPEDIANGTAEYNYTQSPGNHPNREGVSVFYKDDNGDIYHTYSAYARGIDLVNTAYNYLDLVPKGRDEQSNLNWVRFHDKYPE
jgi:predicted dithiol-disulfide oxidoreductase (DUF899 family)